MAAPMDPKDLKQILEILRENDITEFELEEEGTRLRIRKGGPGPRRARRGHPARRRPCPHRRRLRCPRHPPPPHRRPAAPARGRRAGRGRTPPS